eukprot:13911696-Alexandrium_andersonii.AAC.1
MKVEVCVAQGSTSLRTAGVAGTPGEQQKSLVCESACLPSSRSRRLEAKPPRHGKMHASYCELQAK